MVWVTFAERDHGLRLAFSWAVKNSVLTCVFADHLSSADNESELPSVPLGRAEAPIGSYIETPLVSSSPLALCQRKHVKADTLKNVASARINRG